MLRFCFLGLSWEASWGPLGPSWRLQEPSSGQLGRLGAIFRGLGVLWERLVGLFGPSLPVMGPSCLVLAMGTRGLMGAGEHGEQGMFHGRSFRLLCIWCHFLFGRPKTQGPGHNSESILGSMRRGALIIASQEAKELDTHLPLQAR